MHYTLSDLISDIVENSIEADSSEIYLKIDESKSVLKVIVKDNGRGMSTETVKKIKSPFYTDGLKHPGRKTGFGIPFLAQTIQQTNGRLKISSKPGKGTTVYALFNLGNIDTPPLGSLPGLFRQILTYTGKYEMRIHRIKRGKKKLNYKISKKEILNILGETESVKSLSILGDFLELQEN